MTQATLITWMLLTAAILASIASVAITTERNRGSLLAILAGAALGGTITWLAWATCK
jgi:hypothetical protein